MTFPIRSLRIYTFFACLTMLVLVLSACGTPASGEGPITVGGKLDIEAQLFTEMYTLLLRKNGFTVNEKLAYGDTNGLFNAIQRGDIDLYPEFTNTALNLLKIKSTFNPQKDYDTIKKAYEQQYKITWLDRAANLNDGYALCMAKAQSQALGITSLSQLSTKISQLILDTPSDGTAFVDDLKTIYGFDSNSFKQVQTVNYSIGVTAVTKGQAQVTVCYTTDGSIPQQNLVILKDDKNGFPAFNPAPIVRDAVLAKYPAIKTALNPLAPYLTTDVSVSLQKQVAAKKANESKARAIRDVATAFLQSKSLY